MSELRPVRFPRLSTQGIVLWLEWPNLCALIAAVAVAVVSVMTASLLGLVCTLPIWGYLTYIGVRLKHGVPLPILIFRKRVFTMRKLFRMTKQRYRPEAAGAMPLGRLNLPGRGAFLKLWETPHGVLVVYDPQAGTAAISCTIASDTFAAGSDGRKQGLVEAWAQVKGAWTLREGITRISTLERTAPGSASGARAYFAERATVTGSTPERQAPLDILRTSYVQSLDRTDQYISRHRTQLTLTLSAAALRSEIKANGGGIPGLLALAALEVEATTSALEDAGFVGIDWLNARRWAGAGRSIVDPAYSAIIEDREGTDLAGIDPTALGPMSFEEHRDHVVWDSGYHRTFWIHEWPRLETLPGFSSFVVFATLPDKTPIRHVLNIVEAPVKLRDALKRIEDEKKTWRTNQTIRAKTGKPDSASDRAEWTALEEQEEELIAGRGEYRYSGYLTVTGTSLGDLERAASAMSSALARAGLEPQVLYDMQGEALLMNAFPTGRGVK